MTKYYLEKAAQLLVPPLYYSGVHMLTKPFYAGIGQILMFHRVVPKRNGLRIHNHKSLEITPEHLEEVIQFFKKREYSFFSLDDLVEYKKRGRTKKKFVIFTFDDGYIDNYTFAYPIFKKHNIPFTIYVATGLPDGHAILWWYLLEDLLLEKDEIEFPSPGGPMKIVCRTEKEKELAFSLMRTSFATADRQQLQTLVTHLFRHNPTKIVSTTRELSLQWDQIELMSKDPLVTIGAHTVNHFPLASLTRETSSYEILESGKIIGSKISSTIQHFCFPLGSYGTKEIEILKDSGYRTATTIKMANIFDKSLDYPFALPRIMINSLTDQSILKLQVNGLLPALRNSFRRIVN
jgi:peptidoglycan/xylan/chitin deacetylase (PgdA/CDA1 family)